MDTIARCEKTLLGSNVVGVRMRHGQGLELFLLRKSGNLVEMGIRKEERKDKSLKTRECSRGCDGEPLCKGERGEPAQE